MGCFFSYSFILQCFFNSFITKQTKTTKKTKKTIPWIWPARGRPRGGRPLGSRLVESALLYALLHCSIAALLHCCIAACTHCCIAALLHEHSPPLTSRQLPAGWRGGSGTERSHARQPGSLVQLFPFLMIQ